MKSLKSMNIYSRLQPDMDYIVSNFNFNFTLQALNHYQRHLRFNSSKVWSFHWDDTAQIHLIWRRIWSIIRIIFQVEKCEDGIIVPVTFERTLLQLLWFCLQIMAEGLLSCFLWFFLFLCMTFCSTTMPEQNTNYETFEVLQICGKFLKL